MRKILSALGGIIIGSFFVGLFQWAGHILFPATVPFPENNADWQHYMLHVPAGAKFFVVLSYAAGGFTAGLSSTFFQGRTFSRPALVSGGVLQLLAWLNMLSFPHPLWMWLTGGIAVVPMALLAFRLLKRKSGTSDHLQA